MKKFIKPITASVATPATVVFTEDELIVNGNPANDVDEIVNHVTNIPFGAEIKFYWDELAYKKDTYVLQYEQLWESWVLTKDDLKGFANLIEQIYDEDLEEIYDEIEYSSVFEDNEFDEDVAITDALESWIEENLKDQIEDTLDTDKTIVVEVNGTMSADFHVTEIDIQGSNGFASVGVVYDDNAKIENATYTLGAVEDNEYFGW